MFEATTQIICSVFFPVKTVVLPKDFQLTHKYQGTVINKNSLGLAQKLPGIFHQEIFSPAENCVRDITGMSCGYLVTGFKPLYK